jgi:1-acyl-sn-glycerol-3-phosphate acyltransferase
VGIVGAEEQAPGLLDLKIVARLLSMPAFPITPTGLPFPLPTRYHIWFGEPMRFTGPPEDDDAVLEEKVARVKGAVQALLDRGRRERAGIFR